MDLSKILGVPAAEASTPAESTCLDASAFRAEVRAFLDEHATAEIIEAGRKTTSHFPPFEATMKWHRLLYRKGWSAIDWPVEYGGTGWSAVQKRIFREECLRKGVPALFPHGLRMVGPVLMKFGTPEQKTRYLPRILAGEDFWTQGYSEPNAGSDLASLQCRAVVDGDDYVINGTKTWTTYAHYANRMFMLVRTSTQGKPQEGITFLLLEAVDLPGMEVQTIIGLDGVPEQCTVFFEDVRVPRTSRLGEENKGWTVAKYLLEFERGGEGNFGPSLVYEFHRVCELAARTSDGHGGRLIDDPVFRHRLTELEVEIMSADAAERRAATIKKGDPAAMPMASMIKIIVMETEQRITELGIEASGLSVLPWQLAALEVGSGVAPIGDEQALTILPKYLNERAATIFGGSNEIQRGIIARSLLS